MDVDLGRKARSYGARGRGVMAHAVSYAVAYAGARFRIHARHLWSDVVDGLWPDQCWVCRREALGGAGAAACAEHLLEAWLPGDRCRRCAGVLAEGIADGGLCSACRGTPPAFGRAVCAFDYGAASTRAWVLGLKHGGRTDLAAPLVGAAWARIRGRESGLGHGGAILVPVPLHLSRRIQRGHDQAARLAREFAALGAGRYCPVLRRVRATYAQGDPSAPARRKNVSGAFRTVPRLVIPGDVTCWVVDDVMTTGATAAACARTLKRAGASEVNVLAVARA